MDQSLGNHIMENRKRLNLTQDKLAEQLDVTAQAVSKWENGQSYPDITILPRLAEIFGITTDALLGYTPPEILRNRVIVDKEETPEPEEIHVQRGNKAASPQEFTCTKECFRLKKSFCEVQETVRLDTLQDGKIHITFGDATVDLTQISKRKLHPYGSLQL